MYLALQVTSTQAGSLGQNASKVFTEAGGTIGRVAGNDWVLPDDHRFVSGLHAIVRFMGGVFSLEDVSTNGTFLNGDPEPVGAKNEPAILKSGDRLAIGDYEVYVNIVEDESAGVPADSAPELPVAAEPAIPASAPLDDSVPAPQSFQIPEDALDSGPVDPLELLGGAAAEPTESPPAIADHSSPLQDSFVPPDTGQAIPDTASGNAIPDDWELTGFSKPAPPPAPAPAGVPQPEPAPAPAEPVAGTSPAAGDASYADLMPLIVQGMMDILHSRAEIKNEFRVAVTTIKPVDNNPLKFSPTADAAMEQLFESAQPGYLDASSAFEEGFSDIKAHQLAMMAGMRAAFEHMLSQFSPDVLEERFEAAGKKGSFMGMASKSRYWEMYRDFYERLTSDSDDNFRHLFGEEFAEAYERQMQQLTRK